MMITVYRELPLMTEREVYVTLDVTIYLDLLAGASKPYFNPMTGDADPGGPNEWEINEVRISNPERGDLKSIKISPSVIDMLLEDKKDAETFWDAVYQAADDELAYGG